MPSEDANPNAGTRENQKINGNEDTNCSVQMPKSVEEQNAHKFVDLTKLVDAVEQQTEQLKSMNDRHAELFRSMIGQLKSFDERQAAADTSMKPIPQLPANSSSAWMALCQSFKDQVNPAVERLLGGLDALLVFIGLFSAIVTAFLVDSVKNVESDEASRTNDLLANLTEIVLAISGTQFANLSLPYETTFVPESSDVRPNAYWFISLVISLLVAAISVVCRGFLMLIMETTTKSTTPSLALSEVYLRWDNAEQFLKPVAEGIPQLMTLPVILFILGLLDHLFSLNSHLLESSSGLIIAFALSCALAFLTVAVLIFFLVHGIRSPVTSPFQSLFSKAFFEIRDGSTPHGSYSKYSASLHLSAKERMVFERVLEMTRDDTVLEQGSAVLEPVVLQMEVFPMDLLVYILSPEASFRSNLTAAAFISKHLESKPRNDFDATRLLQSCIDLAQRILATRGSRVLLDSEVFGAICALVRPNWSISLFGVPDVFRHLFWENSGFEDSTLVDGRISRQLIQLSYDVTGKYSAAEFTSNIDLMWSTYGEKEGFSDPSDFKLGWLEKVMISRSFRIGRHLQSQMRDGLPLCIGIFQRMVRCMPLDRQTHLLIPLSNVRLSRSESDIVPLFLQALFNESSQKTKEWSSIDNLHLTECTKALSTIARRLHMRVNSEESLPLLVNSLLELAELLLEHPASKGSASFKNAVVQFNISVNIAIQKIPLPNPVEDYKYGKFISRCLELWPNMSVPPQVLKEEFKIKFYPLLDGWERSANVNEAQYYNKHTDSMTKEFPGSSAKPTEITPSDIMLPEDDDDSDRPRVELWDYRGDDRSLFSDDSKGPGIGNLANRKDEPSTWKLRFAFLTGHVLQWFRGINPAGGPGETTSGENLELAERGHAMSPSG